MNLHRADAITCSVRCRSRRHRARRRAASPGASAAPPSGPPAPPGVPSALLAARRWVRWRALPRAGGTCKLPIDPTSGRAASVLAPDTWADYGTAAASSLGEGLGFVLTGDGVACLDVDDCLDADGVPSPAVQRLLDRLPRAWAEVSPSGRGLHVWGRATAAGGRRVVTSSGLSVEFYTRRRYMTVTGRTFRHGDLSESLSLDVLE